MRKYDCIIWDWNGTLIDDLETAIGAVNDILDIYAMEHIDRCKYYKYMDSDIKGFYAHLFDMDKVPYSEITALFSRFYDQRLKTTALMNGAEQVLRILHENGIAQSIVSASHKDKVRRDAAAYDIEVYFDEILGASDNLVNSKVGRAADFMSRRAFLPERTLVIGDLPHDCDMAHEIGADCILIPNGHQCHEQLCLCAAKLVSDITEIPSLVL